MSGEKGTGFQKRPGLILVLLGIPVYFIWKRRGAASGRPGPAHP